MNIHNTVETAPDKIDRTFSIETPFTFDKMSLGKHKIVAGKICTGISV